MTRDSVHAHHVEPWTFIELVREFIVQEGIDREVCYENNGEGSRFADRDFAARWQAFHLEKAKLQLTSEQGHKTHHHAP